MKGVHVVYTHLFFLRILKRIFVNKMTMLMWAKRLQMLWECTGKEQLAKKAKK